jgi:PPIC-type PPIASE domain
MHRLYCLLLVASTVLAQAQSSKQPSATKVANANMAAPISAEKNTTPTAAQNVSVETNIAKNHPVITIHGVCSEMGLGKASADSKSCETIVSKSDFEVFLESLRATGQRVPEDVTPQMRRTIAQTYVETFTFEEAARKAGLDQDPRFLAAMKGLRMSLLSRMYQYRLEKDSKKVASTEIGTYYKNNPEKFEQLELTHIVLPMNNPTNLQDQDFRRKAEQLAQELRDRLAKGEDADKLEKEGFEKLGQKSPPPTNLVPARRGQYSLDQEHQLFALKPGEVTPLIKLPSVYVAYKLISRKTLSLDEAKDEIGAMLASEKLEKETKSIKESVHADLDTGYFGPAPSSSGANSGSGASNFQRVGKTSTSAENPRN